MVSANVFTSETVGVPLMNVTEFFPPKEEFLLIPKEVKVILRTDYANFKKRSLI